MNFAIDYSIKVRQLTAFFVQEQVTLYVSFPAAVFERVPSVH